MSFRKVLLGDPKSVNHLDSLFVKRYVLGTNRTVPGGGSS